MPNKAKRQQQKQQQQDNLAQLNKPNGFSMPSLYA